MRWGIIPGWWTKMQKLAVVRFIGDVVMDNQVAIDVDDALHGGSFPTHQSISGRW